MTPEEINSSKDSTHPDFHLNFGKILSTVLLGLQVFNAAKGGASTFFTSPQNDAQLVSGFASIWITK